MRRSIQPAARRAWCAPHRPANPSPRQGAGRAATRPGCKLSTVGALPACSSVPQRFLGRRLPAQRSAADYASTEFVPLVWAQVYGDMTYRQYQEAITKSLQEARVRHCLSARAVSGHELRHHQAAAEPPPLTAHVPCSASVAVPRIRTVPRQRPPPPLPTRTRPCSTMRGFDSPSTRASWRWTRRSRR